MSVRRTTRFSVRPRDGGDVPLERLEDSETALAEFRGGGVAHRARRLGRDGVYGERRRVAFAFASGPPRERAALARHEPALDHREPLQLNREIRTQRGDLLSD